MNTVENTVYDLNLEDFIAENIEVLKAAAVEAKDPSFKGQLNPTLYEKELKILANLDKNTPLIPLQVEKILAACSSLDKYKSAVASLDTGFGKTYSFIAMSLVYAVKKLQNNPSGTFNSFIISPPHLVKKWAAEIRKYLSGVIEFNIIEVNSYKDIECLTRKGADKKGFNFFIVSKSKMSLSYKREQTVRVRKSYDEFETMVERIRGDKVLKKKITKLGYRWHIQCTSCFGDLKEPQECISGLEPNTALKNSKIRKCKHCGESIMSPVEKKIGIAEYLSIFGIRGAIDILADDEVHEEKERDTLRSKAFGTILSKSKRVVGLSGTLLGGYASHAFYILYRMFPSVFKEQLFLNWEDINEFIDEYGGSETHFEIKSGEELDEIEKGRSYGTKERADLSPRLLDVLLPMVVFGRIDQLKFENKAVSLPKYTETSHLVEHDTVFQMPQMNYLGDLAIASSKVLKEYDDRSGFGKLKTDALLVPDMPYKKVGITLHVEGRDETFEYLPPVTREEYPITNKEKKLIELIKKARSEGKKVLVYHDFVNSGLREELIDVITIHTRLRVQELNSKIDAKKREAYIKSLECDVLITNPELVKTGLDLLEYPTIIFYQQAYSSYNVFTMRQAAKRAWRIGQTVDCEVHTIAYSGTMQQKALSLMGAKMNISQGVEGRLSTGEDIASEAEDENLQIAMARALLKNEKVDASATTSSKTLDLDARDWSPFEAYYIEHLQNFRANPQDYTAVIPTLVKDVVKETVLNVEEPVVSVVTNVETKPKPQEAIAPKKMSAVYEYKVSVNKKEKSKSVSETELVELVKQKGKVQLSLF